MDPDPDSSYQDPPRAEINKQLNRRMTNKSIGSESGVSSVRRRSATYQRYLSIDQGRKNI
jgi:hypothetical protein